MKELEKYKGYFIDESGNLFSTKSNKYIKHRLSKFGYIRVGIYHNGKSKQLFIHRLLAETFIPNPENKKDVNHINGIKSDFSLENLEWNTRSENVKHAFRIGLNKVSDKARKMSSIRAKEMTLNNHPNKKKVSCFNKDGEKINTFSSIREASLFYSISEYAICNNLTGRSKSCNNKIWKYEK